jgi:GNAT superfamily N-acetyltransferase
MLEVRAATLEDVEVITRHRRLMFMDAGHDDSSVLDLVSERFEPWVKERILQDRYLGWLAVIDGRVVAGLGLLLLDWPPHPLDPSQSLRAYLLNMYVEPEHRRQGIGGRLMELALDEARRRKIRVTALHATDAGRSLYESKAFKATNEMFYIEPEPVS